jgi:hypothetical protein
LDSSPLSHDQIDFFDSLFTTDDMTLIVVQKYDLLNRLHAVFETQSLSKEHRCQLFTIVVKCVQSINTESSPFVRPFFELFVVPVIRTDDQRLFEQAVHLFTILLQCREEPALTNLMFSDVNSFLME